MTVILIAVVGVLMAFDPNSSVFEIVSFAWAGFGATLYGECILCRYGSLGIFLPIMMASCAAVMPMSSITYIKSGKYDKLMSILIMISGVFGVATAAYLVKSM